VVRLCTARGQPIVLHGGRTGVSGGAYTREGDVALSLERMNRIEEIDPDSQLAVAQAGVPLATLQAAAAEHGLMYPIDLISQGSATVGGTISTNAGGNRVIRWGMTRRHILGLEVVLADGTVLPATNRLVKNNTGYDLKQLFIGAEGTLGIVTKAVLQLVPLPTTQSVCFLSVANYANVKAILGRAKRLATLSAFEVMWRDYYSVMAASGTGRNPVAADQPFYILVETLGYNEAFDQQIFESFLEAIHEDGLVADAVLATSDRQRQDLWKVREGAEVVGPAMSPFVAFDLSIDLRQTEACVDEIREMLVRRFQDSRMMTWGHLGDNNIHVCAHIGPDTRARELEVEDEVFRVLGRFGGAISAEHGIGQTKRTFLHYCKSPEELRLMRSLKATLDAGCLFNPEVLFEPRPRDDGSRNGEHP
jgi:FAD/FMN-containing dehydrogenase